MKQLIASHLANYPGMQFITAYQETKADTELEALHSYTEQCGPWAGTMDYQSLPFLVAYETTYNKRARYGNLSAWLKDYEAENRPENGSYIMALVDALSLFDTMIYEHYDTIRTIYKAAVKRILGGQLLQTEEPLQAAYAMVRGCNLGILSVEKYLSYAQQLMQTEIAAEADGVTHELNALTHELLQREEEERCSLI